jgi:hypothetical protein
MEQGHGDARATARPQAPVCWTTFWVDTSGGGRHLGYAPPPRWVGCLPLLVQLPVYSALFFLLRTGRYGLAAAQLAAVSLAAGGALVAGKALSSSTVWAVAGRRSRRARGLHQPSATQ